MHLSATPRMAECLAALGNEHRLKIVELLRNGERCVCKLTPEFDLDPSVVSRHLAVLEQAGVVVSRRDGHWIHYRVADPRVLRLVDIARDVAEHPEPARPAKVRKGSKRRAC